jgi:NAD kinase
MTIDRIVVVTKKTALEELLDRHYSRGQVKFYLESRGSRIEPYVQMHQAYHKSLEKVLTTLPRDIPHVRVERSELHAFLFRTTDLMVAIGPDGLFVNLAKYLTGQPVIGVNPDPDTVNGITMRHRPEQVPGAITAVVAGTAEIDLITLAQLTTNDGRQVLAVNDFLIGRRDQISARYRITQGRTERQSSSGILVSTGLGTSGWLSSILNMVTSLGGSADTARALQLGWGDPALVFVVREPFASRDTQAGTVSGRIQARQPLVVESEMPEGGYIISDGMVDDGLEFNSGTTVTVKPAATQAKLVRP